MARTRWLDDAQQRDWRSFLLGSALLFERLERDLRGAGLSLAEYEILVRLSEQPSRSSRMAELARSVQHSRSRLTHTITRLERAGLVERRVAPSDGRGVEAHLTPTGYARLVEVAPLHVEGVRRNLVDVVDPADFEAIGRAFRAVTSLLEGDRDPATQPTCPDDDSAAA